VIPCGNYHRSPRKGSFRQKGKVQELPYGKREVWELAGGARLDNLESGRRRMVAWRNDWWIVVTEGSAEIEASKVSF
jgi:hypothetical protein